MYGESMLPPFGWSSLPAKRSMSSRLSCWIERSYSCKRENMLENVMCMQMNSIKVNSPCSMFQKLNHQYQNQMETSKKRKLVSWDLLKSSMSIVLWEELSKLWIHFLKLFKDIHSTNLHYQTFKLKIFIILKLLKLLPLQKAWLKPMKLGPLGFALCSQVLQSWKNSKHQLTAGKGKVSDDLLTCLGSSSLKGLQEAPVKLHSGDTCGANKADFSSIWDGWTDHVEHNSLQYLNKMFEDLWSICWTEVSCKNTGHDLPHPVLRAAAGAHSQGAALLPRLTDNQVQFGLGSDGVITQSVPIWRNGTATTHVKTSFASTSWHAHLTAGSEPARAFPL